MKPLITRDRFGRPVSVGRAQWLGLALCVAVWLGLLAAFGGAMMSDLIQ